MYYTITPVPKPRMTRSDKFNKRDCVMRYWAFKDECKLKKVYLSECGQSITFILPMPESWPKSKRALHRGKPHQQTPDLDNLLKALQDAVMPQDKTLHQINGLCKIWGDAGAIIIEG